MSILSGFFDSIDDDRMYKAEEISSFFDGLINDGIFRDFKDALKVEHNSSTDGNLSIIVKSGRTWFNHIWMHNDDIHIINNIEPNTVESDRIDAVVVDVDLTDDVREATILYINGTNDGKFPNLIRESFHCQYPLAYITVKQNATEITEENINDRRGKSTIDRGEIIGKEYGTPWAMIMMGNSGLKTNLPGLVIEGFQFSDEDIKKDDMQPNLFYGVAEKIE